MTTFAAPSPRTSPQVIPLAFPATHVRGGQVTSFGHFTTKDGAAFDFGASVNKRPGSAVAGGHGRIEIGRSRRGPRVRQLSGSFLLWCPYCELYYDEGGPCPRCGRTMSWNRRH